MTIYPFCANLIKYEMIQSIIARYYRYKMGKPCFIMWQNNRWTVVTIDM